MNTISSSTASPVGCVAIERIFFSPPKSVKSCGFAIGTEFPLRHQALSTFSPSLSFSISPPFPFFPFSTQASNCTHELFNGWESVNPKLSVYLIKSTNWLVHMQQRAAAAAAAGGGVAPVLPLLDRDEWNRGKVKSTFCFIVKFLVNTWHMDLCFAASVPYETRLK